MEAGRALTPIVVLSADATATAMRECELAGARAFLSKPIVLNRLLEILADIALGSDRAESTAPVSVEPPTLESQPVISDETLEGLAELQLGEGFVALFIDECLRDALKIISELERSGASAQWDLFRDQCHALKGVAANMGAARLAARASDGMRLGDWQLPRERERCVGDLRHQYEMARAALKGVTRDDPSIAGRIGSIDPVPQR
jgi:two-component system sensor histidine kinase RpfC